MAVTIKDIAKRAGVSYSTVSRALNGIGTEKRNSVVSAVKQYRHWTSRNDRPPYPAGYAVSIPGKTRAHSAEVPILPDADSRVLQDQI